MSRIAARVAHPWRWIGLGAVVCVLAWVALAMGLILEVDRTKRFVLVTIAVVVTEGLFWLSALLMGLRVFEARRQLWNKLRSVFR